VDELARLIDPIGRVTLNEVDDSVTPEDRVAERIQAENALATPFMTFGHRGAVVVRAEPFLAGHEIADVSIRNGTVEGEGVGVEVRWSEAGAAALCSFTQQ